MVPVYMPAIQYERWTPITETSVPGIGLNEYYVSDFGRVYSMKRRRFLNLQIIQNGYYRVFLTLKDGSKRYYLIHRIVMIEFHYIDNYQDMQVNHKDGDKSYNYDDNLEWTTSSKNIQHAYDNGLKVKEFGEDCSYAVITNEQAHEVAKLLIQQKYSHIQISQMTGVPIHIVHNISDGTTWSKVLAEYHLENYKREARPGFSDEDLHKLCQYFEQNHLLYPIKTDLYRHALKDLFGIIYDAASMSASMSRIFNHKTRKDITDKYNF